LILKQVDAVAILKWPEEEQRPIVVARAKAVVVALQDIFDKNQKRKVSEVLAEKSLEDLNKLADAVVTLKWTEDEQRPIVVARDKAAAAALLEERIGEHIIGEHIIGEHIDSTGSKTLIYHPESTPNPLRISSE
jgi:hypothetical protein